MLELKKNSSIFSIRDVMRKKKVIKIRKISVFSNQPMAMTAVPAIEFCFENKKVS